MIPKLSPARALRALAVAVVVATISTRVSAQEPQSPNLAAPAGAAAIVIVPDSLPGAARTVSELLRDYAPFASVQRATGAVGASPFVSFRDASAILGKDPLVVVDGIRQVSARANLDTLDRREPSILDDIMLDDVARVEILPGPAAAASYGDDGRRGAIVITTRAPGWAQPRFRASVTTSSADANPGYARNLSRVSANGLPCAYYQEAAGTCTATATTRYTPLLDRSPFRSAQQLRAHLGVSGGAGPLGYAASLGAERGSGIMESDVTDRTVASLRLRMPVGSIVRVGLSSFASGRGITFPAESYNSVLAWGVGGGPLDCSPATPCGSDSASGGYGYPLSFLEQRQPHRRIGHLGTALTVDVDPRPALSLRTLVTGDMFRDVESLRDSSPPGYASTITAVTARERSWRVDAAEEARFTARVAGATATTALNFRFDADRGRSSSGTNIVLLPYGGYPGGAWSQSTTEAWLFRDRYSQALDQRLAWAGRAALGAGVTRTTTDFNQGRRAPAILDPHADAEYDLVAAGRPSGIVESLRLRTAWAQSSAQDLGALERPSYRTTSYGGYGYGFPAGPRTPADRSTELEGGIDAAFSPASSRLSITAFLRKERLDWIAPFLLTNTDERKVTGSELLAEATPLDLPGARLHVRGQLAVSHDRVESGPGVLAPLSIGPGIELVIDDGQSWGTWLTQPASWSDANGNGRIERNEVTYFNVQTGGRSRPASTGSLSADLEVLGSFSISATADHVGGFDVFDAASAQQCWRKVCQALNDPNASIDEQGRAVAVAAVTRGAGFLVPGDATTLRELSLSWQSTRVATALHAATLRVTLSGYDLARWTRSKGLHPETDAPAAGLRPNLWSITLPVPRTFALRVALGY